MNSCHIGFYDNINKSKYDAVVCKTHNMTEDQIKKFKIILLPIRNIIDASISENTRNPKMSHLNSCFSNINYFNYLKPYATFIFVYEKYSIKYIKQLCRLLYIELTNMKIIEIMIELDNMLKSKDIPEDK